MKTLKIQVKTLLIEGLVIKPCHDNNVVAIYVGRAVTVHNPLFQRSRYSWIS